MTMLVTVAGFIATYCTGLFAGAALYIDLVEHPARMECGTSLAIAQFRPSYRRATVMQVSLAVVAFVAALTKFSLARDYVCLVGGVLIVAVIPFTLIAILPTNKKLLDATLDRESDLSRRLLVRWGKLHAVRVSLSSTAFLVFLLSLTT